MESSKRTTADVIERAARFGITLDDEIAEELAGIVDDGVLDEQLAVLRLIALVPGEPS